MDRLLQQIQKFEGFRSKPYWDHKQWTVGYGTKARGQNDTVSRSQGLTRLQARLQKDVDRVNRFAPNAPQGTKDALTSLTYNAGSGWMNKGLGRLVKSGNWDAAKRRFQQYNRASGKVNPALVGRRATEAEWFGRGAPQAPHPEQPVGLGPAAGSFRAAQEQGLEQTDLAPTGLGPAAGSFRAAQEEGLPSIFGGPQRTGATPGTHRAAQDMGMPTTDPISAVLTKPQQPGWDWNGGDWQIKWKKGVAQF